MELSVAADCLFSARAAGLLLASFLGSTVATTAGFGGAVVFQSVFFLLQPFVPSMGNLSDSVALSSWRSVTANVHMLFISFRFLDRRMFQIMLPGLVVGAPLGYVMLTVFPEAVMKQLLGALCLLVTIERLISLFLCRSSSVDPAASLNISLPPTPALVRNPASPPDSPPSPPLKNGGDEGGGDVSPRSDVSRFSRDSELERADERTCGSFTAVAVTGLGTGVLGAGLGQPGVSMMFFSSYMPMHKTTIRTLRAAAVVPVTTFSFGAMVADGTVDVARDWLLLLAVFGASTLGVQLGGWLHAFVDRDTTLTVVLMLLAVTAYTLLADAAPLAPLPLLAVIAVATATFARAVVVNCRRQCGGGGSTHVQLV